MKWFASMIAIALTTGAPLTASGQATKSEVELLREEIKKLQERLERIERRPAAPAQPPAPAAPAAPVVPAVPGEREISLEREHPLETIGPGKPEVSGFRFSGFFAGSASYNSHIQMVPEFAGGGSAQSDPKSLNFRFDKFSFGVSRTFASWLSASGTIEVESHRDRHTHGFDPAFGCPGAGLCIERFGAEEAETEIELHRFQITGIVPVGNGLALSFGRFDPPFGIERHDPNLLLTATNSEVFKFGRPNSMTGFQAAYQFAPWLDATTWLVNRWESENTHDPFDDNNREKSVGGRIGITPFPGKRLLNFGVGGWWGKEQDDDTANERWVIDFDAT